jgi:hypothetical protein
MISLHIQNETAPLKAVVLGVAQENGPTPKLEDAYDPKSREHIKAGTYPLESDMIREMEDFATVLKKYGVKVYRPEIIRDCNQIFSRDIAFVIEDTLIKANILPDREEEYQAIKYIVDQITYEETDFREPTLADNTSDDGYGVLPKEGDEVWRDVTNSEVVGRNWRDPSDWKVNIEARGKLLPIPENGVPILDIGINQIVLEPNDADSGTSAGEGYEEIDTFTTTGGSGSGVVISCTTNPDDTIKSLTVVHAGNGFLPEDFLDNPAPEAPADPVDPADPVTYSHGEATVKIVPLDVVSGGTGLSAFVKSGIIKNIYKTIAKPVEITALGLVDISVAPRSPNDDDTSNDKAIDEIKTTSVDVTSSPSSNKEYDVFFHFHNDITHTFIDGKWAHNAFGGGPTNEEQAIDLQISAI